MQESESKPTCLEFWGDSLKDFQKRNFLVVDGKEGPQTRRALSRTRDEWIKLIEANIQRLLSLETHEHGILVNVAMYSLFGLYQGDILHQQKVVVGGPRTPTPLLTCSMNGMTFHPSWGVPPSIFLRSLRSKVCQNPQYLADHHYDVFDRDGMPVDPMDVAWDNLSLRYFPYRISQQPGPYNSLGMVKFHLDNPQNIHLHDTPHKELFSRNVRALSSGCVRLEQPDKLAEWLGIPYDEDVKPQHITFEETIPVTFAYITLWFDGDTLYVSNDPYRRDLT